MSVSNLTKAERRHAQARLLNAWARQQMSCVSNLFAFARVNQQHTRPLIAMGDDNFDWDVSHGEAEHDQVYDFLTADGIFVWL